MDYITPGMVEEQKNLTMQLKYKTSETENWKPTPSYDEKGIKYVM